MRYGSADGEMESHTSRLWPLRRTCPSTGEGKPRGPRPGRVRTGRRSTRAGRRHQLPLASASVGTRPTRRHRGRSSFRADVALCPLLGTQEHEAEEERWLKQRGVEDGCRTESVETACTAVDVAAGQVEDEQRHQAGSHLRRCPTRRKSPHHPHVEACPWQGREGERGRNGGGSWGGPICQEVRVGQDQEAQTDPSDEGSTKEKPDPPPAPGQRRVLISQRRGAQPVTAVTNTPSTGFSMLGQVGTSSSAIVPRRTPPSGIVATTRSTLPEERSRGRPDATPALGLPPDCAFSGSGPGPSNPSGQRRRPPMGRPTAKPRCGNVT